MLDIKLSIAGHRSDIDIKQFTGLNGNVCDDCRFFVNSDVRKADYWFVIDDLNVKTDAVQVPKENIFFFTAEVSHPFGHYDQTHLNLFLEQFSKIYTCYDIYNQNSFYDLPFLPWMINSNHGHSIFSVDEIVNVDSNPSKKSKEISVFCSDKVFIEGHKLRLKFVRAIKDYFGDALDWYGNGINQVGTKIEGIAPYKYHIVLENQSAHNIITEKLYDSFLGMAYPIYWGAPNVSDYFPKDSFTSIEIRDIKSSILAIEKLLLSDKYSTSLPYISDARNMVLNDYNLFKRLSAIASQNSLLAPVRARERVALKSSKMFKQKSITSLFRSACARLK